MQEVEGETHTSAMELIMEVSRCTDVYMSVQAMVWLADFHI